MRSFIVQLWREIKRPILFVFWLLGIVSAVLDLIDFRHFGLPWEFWVLGSWNIAVLLMLVWVIEARAGVERLRVSFSDLEVQVKEDMATLEEENRQLRRRLTPWYKRLFGRDD